MLLKEIKHNQEDYIHCFSWCRRKKKDYNLQARVEIGEALPSFGKTDGEVAMRLRTRLKRNKLWNLYRIETKDIGEVLVPYSFAIGTQSNLMQKKSL